jgi:AcrR family transcriptional regulator
MAKKPDNRMKIIEAAMALAAERNWRDISMAEIADAAGIGIGELYDQFSSRAALLNAFGRMVDAEVLGAGAADPDEPAADRLFDVLMRRFDVLNRYKPGLASVIDSTARDPLSALCSAAQLRQSMAWMLEAAGLSTDGWRGMVRIKGLSAVYLYAMRTWLRDDSEDMAKTMAALDKALKRADRLARGFERAGRRGRAPQTDEPAADAAI